MGTVEQGTLQRNSMGMRKSGLGWGNVEGFSGLSSRKRDGITQQTVDGREVGEGSMAVRKTPAAQV